MGRERGQSQDNLDGVWSPVFFVGWGAHRNSLLKLNLTYKDSHPIMCTVASDKQARSTEVGRQSDS